jgi:hypothetical protein
VSNNELSIYANLHLSVTLALNGWIWPGLGSGVGRYAVSLDGKMGVELFHVD